MTGIDVSESRIRVCLESDQACSIHEVSPELGRIMVDRTSGAERLPNTVERVCRTEPDVKRRESTCIRGLILCKDHVNGAVRIRHRLPTAPWMGEQAVPVSPRFRRRCQQVLVGQGFLNLARSDLATMVSAVGIHPHHILGHVGFRPLLVHQTVSMGWVRSLVTARNSRQPHSSTLEWPSTRGLVSPDKTKYQKTTRYGGKVFQLPNTSSPKSELSSSWPSVNQLVAAREQARVQARRKIRYTYRTSPGLRLSKFTESICLINYLYNIVYASANQSSSV